MSDQVAEAFGYMTKAEINFMKRLLVQCPVWSTIVNIGAGAGTSGLVMAEIRPAGMRYTVDISPGGPYGGLDGERNAFYEKGLMHLLPDQILGDSAEVGRSWFIPLDALFIDADHSESGITADIDAWVRHVNNGGLVMFHDYGSHNWPAVQQVVDKMMKDHTFLGVVDTLAAYKVVKQNDDSSR